MVALLDRFFLLELMKAKMQDFINCRRLVCVKEYSLKFTQFARFALTMV